MSQANINEQKTDLLTNNIMMVLEGEKPHDCIAAVTQAAKILSLTLNMSFEDMMDDMNNIHNVLYADATLGRVEG